MIGLGAKYLTAAGFGRYRITAASLGSNLMFGSLWLMPATRQAIMAAFGVDGPAVIRATNEYLNGIAASDKAKATALASYINEDPMMVCSLGLEPQGVTMPKRVLVIPNAAASTGRNNKIITDVPMNQIGKVVLGIQRLTTTSNMGYIFITTDGSNPCCGIGYNSLSATFTPSLGNLPTLTDQTVSFTNSGTGKLGLYLFGNNDTNWTDDSASNYAKVYARDLTTLLLDLVPFKHKTGEDTYECVMLDLLAVGVEGARLFYANVGSGSFTIPDISYTP